MLSLKHRVVQLALVLASISFSDGAKMYPPQLTRSRRGVSRTSATGTIVKSLRGERRLQDDSTSTFFDVKGVSENEPESMDSAPSPSTSPSTGKGRPDKKPKPPGELVAGSDLAPASAPYTILVPIGSPTSLPGPIGSPTSLPADSETPSERPSSSSPPVDATISLTSPPVDATISLTPPPTPTPTVLPAGTSVMCPGEIVKKSEVAWWTYAVTLDDTAYTKADADGAAVAVEYKLQAFLSELMDCNRPGGRRLQEQLGIVGMDNLPDDVFQEDCPRSAGDLPCFVYMGAVTLMLKEEADLDIAVFEIRKAVESAMSKTDSFSIPKVASIEYLSPDLSSPSSAETTDKGESNSLEGGKDGASSTISVLSAIGGLFVVVAMVAAYRMRKDRVDSKSIVGPSTVLGETSQNAGDGSSPRSGSPYGGILHGTYQLGGSFGMNTILEDNQSRGSSEIIVSDCGYTDDDSSRDQSYAMSVVHDDSSILGARGAMPLFDHNDDDDGDDEVLFDERALSPSHSSKAATMSD